MIIYGIEYPTEDKTRNIKIQNSLEDVLLNLQAHYDFIYNAVKNGLIYPDYATQSLGRLTWKNKDSKEWF